MEWVKDHRAAILGFAVSAAYWPGMLSAAWVPRWAAIAVGVALVSRLDPREVAEPVRWLLAFLVALGAISLLGSPDPRAGTLELIFMVILAGAFLMGAELKSFDSLMNGIALGLVPSLFALFLGLDSDADRYDLEGNPAGLFHNTEVFAEFAALVLAWAIARKDLIVGAAALGPVLLLQSRIAMLAVLIATAYAYWPRQWRWRLAIVAAALTIPPVMIFVFGLGKVASVDQRLIIWLATVFAITPFGSGLGWFQAAHPAEEFAHSDLLQMVVEMGPLSLVSLAIPVIAFRSQRGTNAERALLIAVGVEVILSFPLHTPSAGFLAAAVAGFLVGGCGPLRDDAPMGGMANVDAVRRGEAIDNRGPGIGGRRGGFLSPRPVSAREAALRARHDRLDTGAGEIEEGRGSGLREAPSAGGAS